MKRIITALLVIMALASLSFMPQRGSIKLRLKPQQGKTYTITYKNTATNKMEVQGQTMNQSIGIDIRQSFSANEVSDKKSVIETQIDAIKMSTSVMGMKIEYDSEHPENSSPYFGDLGSELNKVQTFTYDALGHVEGLTDRSMSQLDVVIIQLPEEELNVGSKWTSRKAQNISGIDYFLDIEYEVVSISKKSVDLSFNGIYRLDLSEDAGTASGTYNGSCSINPQTGILTSSTGKMNISMTINQEGISIPTTMVGSTTISVK